VRNLHSKCFQNPVDGCSRTPVIPAQKAFPQHETAQQSQLVQSLHAQQSRRYSHNLLESDQPDRAPLSNFETGSRGRQTRRNLCSSELAIAAEIVEDPLVRQQTIRSGTKHIG